MSSNVLCALQALGRADLVGPFASPATEALLLSRSVVCRFAGSEVAQMDVMTVERVYWCVLWFVSFHLRSAFTCARVPTLRISLELLLRLHGTLDAVTAQPRSKRFVLLFSCAETGAC